MLLPVKSQEQIDNAAYPLKRGEVVFNADTCRMIVGTGSRDLADERAVEEPDYTTLTTTDATPTTLATIAIPDDHVGTMELKVLSGDTTNYRIDIYEYVFQKNAGTLQGSGALVHGGGALASSFTVGAGTGDYVVTATGVAATTIYWKCYYKILSLNHIP